MDWATIIAAVAAAILGAGGVTPLVKNWLAARRTEMQDDRKFSDAMFTRMEERIIHLEAAERECLDAKEKLSVEVGGLRERMVALEHVSIAGHVECDEKGIITAWSAGSERLLGWSAEEMVGKSIEDLMPVYARHAHRAAFRRALEPNHQTRNIQMRDAFGLNSEGKTIPLTIILNSWDINGVKYFDAEIHRRDGLTK